MPYSRRIRFVIQISPTRNSDWPANWMSRALACLMMAFALSLGALAQVPQANAPAGMTIVLYTNKGQNFEFRLFRGEVVAVLQNGRPVVMYLQGSPRPVSQDGNAVAAAEAAVQAYKSGNPSGGAATGASVSTAGLTVDAVLALLNAGISDDLIIARIQRSGQSIDLSADDMIRLKQAKGSDALMKAMMNAAPAPSANPAPSPSLASPSGVAASLTVSAPPNSVAENPNMGKLPKESFFGGIGHSASNSLHGRSVIDQLSMRNILPQWDPNKRLDQQFPHIAITVLDAPSGWTDDYRDTIRKDNHSALPRCFKMKAVVWLDAQRSKTTDEFSWCLERDTSMSDLQPTYMLSLAQSQADFGQTTGINRTDGPEPPDTLLPNDRATLGMWAKTDRAGSGKDMNLDQLSVFALMFANVRRDLGETLGSDGDYRVWVTAIKKAAGPALF